MNLSQRELESIVVDLDRTLPGARIQEIRNPDEETVVLSLYGSVSSYLLLCVHPGGARIHLISERTGTLNQPTSFVMLLRKLLSGARVAAVDMPWDDRVAVIRFHGEERPDLLLELSGHHPNLFLLGEEDRIRGSLVSPRSHHRTLNVGECYEPPIPSPGRSDCWRFDAGVPIHPQVEEYFRHASENRILEQSRSRLEGRLKGELKRLERAITKVQSDLSRALDWQQMRRYGECLKGVSGGERRGLTSVSGTDWSADPPATVEVPLDPALSVRDNMEGYFRRARRGVRGEEKTRKRLLELEALKAPVEAALEALEGAKSLLDVEELNVRVAGFLQRKGSRKGRNSPAQRRLAYFVFVSSTGRRILVGRGGKDNQFLTFQVASPHDIWMHARGVSGSHVVIPMAREQEPDLRTLIDAAHLAQRYSKGPAQGFCEVMWTRKKWVRSIKGGALGQVTVVRDCNLSFEFDDSILDGLSREPQAS